MDAATAQRIDDWLNPDDLRLADWFAQTSYPHPELRRPRNLPLDDVRLGVPVTIHDAMSGVWPPPRGMTRQRRMHDQREAAQGRLDKWLGDGAHDVQLPVIHDTEQTMLAVLMASPPQRSDPALQRRLQTALETAAIDMIRHGQAFLMGDATAVDWVDARACWPLMSASNPAGWLIVLPTMSDQSASSHLDVIDILVAVDGMVGGIARESSGTPLNPTSVHLGETIATYPDTPATIAVAQRPPMNNDWGSSLVDRLIPLAVEMVRRESGASWVIDRNERPIAQFRASTADLLARGLLESDEDENLRLSAMGRQTLQAIQRSVNSQAQSLRQHDVLLVPDGMDLGEMLTWDQDMAASEAFLDRLDRRWTQATGFAPVEAADSGAVSSGVAVARRNAMGVARVRAHLWAPLKHAAETVLGGELEWPFIDDEMADEGEGLMLQPDTGMGDMGMGAL